MPSDGRFFALTDTMSMGVPNPTTGVWTLRYLKFSGSGGSVTGPLLDVEQKEFNVPSSGNASRIFNGLQVIAHCFLGQTETEAESASTVGNDISSHEMG